MWYQACVDEIYIPNRYLYFASNIWVPSFARCGLTNSKNQTFSSFCEINASKFCSKNKFYTLLYIIIWLLMAILSRLQLIHVWFDFILRVSCSWRNHIILLLMFVAEKVLLLLVISLTLHHDINNLSETKQLLLLSLVVQSFCVFFALDLKNPLHKQPNYRYLNPITLMWRHCNGESRN